MSDGTDYLKAIKKKLESGQRQWKRGDKILAAYGYVRRRQTFVDQINAELEALGLRAFPPITTGISLDAYTSFYLNEAPSADVATSAAIAAPEPEVVDEIPPEVAAEAAAELASPPTVDATNPADLAVTVRNLEAAQRQPLMVNPNDDLASALTKMQLNDYSQLVVATGLKSVKGVVSYKSIAIQDLHGQPQKVAECIDDSIPQVTLNEPLLDVVARFETHDCVLVFKDDKSICGIVTPADIAHEFRAMTAPFLIIGEIETHLRWFIDRAIDIANVTFSAAPPPAPGKLPAEAADLTMGEIERILENPEYWKQVGLPYDRVDFCAALGKMRQFRNETMHFGDLLTEAELHSLRTFANTLRVAAGAMAANASKAKAAQ